MLGVLLEKRRNWIPTPVKRTDKAKVKKLRNTVFTPSLLRTARKHVDYLQKTLYRAVNEKWKLRDIHRYSRLLLNSYYNKILAIYKVTRLNGGKKTAGIDGIKIKIKSGQQLQSLTRKLEFALNRNKWKPSPNRRIDIPKPDGTTRPLGIPTQFDRIVQHVLNSILEIDVEHLIHSHKLSSFGFRKKFSTADAINNLAVYAHKGKQGIVIEADISKCFDHIAHTYIMDLCKKKIYATGIKRLLKAGHWDIETSTVITEDMGTPQGGVISPTISNLVLRTALDKGFTETKPVNTIKCNLTTYADDLIISISPQGRTTKDTKKYQEWVNNTSEKLMTELNKRLAIAGLELKPSKTRVITDDSPFNFLGYEIQRGKGIRMAKDKVARLRSKLKDTMKRGRNVKRVLKELNPILRGFYNYAAKFSSGKMWKQMGKIDWEVSTRIFKLFKTYDIGQVKYTDIPKTVKYMSPPKGATWLMNQEFWDARELKNMPLRKRKLYKVQQGICPYCHGKMFPDQVLETHHLKQTAKGGKDTNDNVVLIHHLCHSLNHSENQLTN